MTNLYVQEYASLGYSVQENTPAVPGDPPLASYVVSYSAGVASGPQYQANTRYLTVEADSICSVRFDGTAATVTDKRLPANNAPLLVSVAGCPNGHVSAITNT